MNPTLSFNDVEIGFSFTTDSYKLELDELVSFAKKYDPQAIHLDEAAAQQGPFGKVIASGWQTLALTMKLMTAAKPFGETPLIGVSLQGVEFKQPVFADTSFFVTATVTDKKKSIKMGEGFVTMTIETRCEETKEVLVRQKTTVWFSK